MSMLSGLAPLLKFGEFTQNWLSVDHFFRTWLFLCAYLQRMFTKSYYGRCMIEGSVGFAV